MPHPTQVGSRAGLESKPNVEVEREDDGMGVASNGSGEGAEDEEMEQPVTGAIKKLRLFNKAFPSVEARAVVEKLDSLRGARRTHLPSILVYVSRNGPQPNRLSSHMKMGRVNELSANTYDDAAALVRISQRRAWRLVGGGRHPSTSS